MKNTIQKITAFLFTTVLLYSTVFAEKDRVYISPNNDGIQDELIVPIKISDKR